MAHGTPFILLVDRPGHLRDALASLVGAIPGLPPPVTADCGLLALKVLRELSGPASPCRLVLIEGGLPEAEVLELLRQIKQVWPEIGCLVMAEGAAERQQALDAGADRALGVGLPASRLYAVLQEMLVRISRTGSPRT